MQIELQLLYGVISTIGLLVTANSDDVTGYAVANWLVGANTYLAMN